MRFYLQREDGSISDHADYGDKSPADRDDGEWVAGDLPVDSRVWSQKLPLNILLEEADFLTLEARALLAPTEAVLVYLLNKLPADTDAATLLVENLPDEPFASLKLAVLGALQ